ncbi:carotenoid biosynthesis protein [Thermococcus sp. M39]|uniref:carotenoid biosynthesis protein n=1 Tax=Thermococcus sp. M39 TaxID=1638262 RepID=UPI00143B5EC0|nr:carotenoid biosynthesis protein [Thermococcus sp. M39]NJE08631.1 carotenoid biosynthesis protein [Thermococcus sp. M39]
MKNDIKTTLTLIVLANILKKSPIYLLLYFLAFIILSRRAWKSLPKLLLWAFIVGFSAELLGTHSCLPFGCYEYVNLKPQIFGVGLSVPFAWGIFGAVAYLTASCFFRNSIKRILFAALLMVVIDLSVDPIMTSWKAWVWKTTTSLNWFGIPWTNYLGWFLVSLVFFYLYERFSNIQIESKLLKLGPPIYLLEMFTFTVYSPASVRIPTMIAFAISIVVILLVYFWRMRV